jgi:hypothetical protein
MDLEKAADKIAKNEQVDLEDEDMKRYKRKRNIFIVAGVSLILVLLLGSWFGGSAYKKSNLQVKSKARRIYFSKHESVVGSSFIYSVDQNGENERPLIDSCPEGGPFCLLKPVGVSPDGEFILFNCMANRKAYMIRKNGKDLQKIDGGEAAAFFSPDGKYICLFNAIENIVAIRNVQDLKKSNEFTISNDFLGPLQFSQNGKFIQSVNHKDEVYNFDPETGKIVGEKIANPGFPSPDGEKVLWIDQKGFFIANSDGKNKLHLENMKNKPSWSLDSKSILVDVSIHDEDEDKDKDEDKDDACEIQILQLNPERTAVSNTKIVKRVHGESEIFAVW